MPMTIEMPEAMEKRVRERCAREGRSVGEGVVAAVVAWLGEGPREGTVRSLKGMLGYRGRTVSLEEMERAIGMGGAV